MSRRAGHERKNLKMLVKPKSFMKLNHRKDSEEWTESKECIPLTVILSMKQNSGLPKAIQDSADSWGQNDF